MNFFLHFSGAQLKLNAESSRIQLLASQKKDGIAVGVDQVVTFIANRVW